LNYLLAIAFSLIHNEFPLVPHDSTKLFSFCFRCGQQFEAPSCPRCLRDEPDGVIVAFSAWWLEQLKRIFEDSVRRPLTEEEFNEEMDRFITRLWETYRMPDFFQALLALSFTNLVCSL